MERERERFCACAMARSNAALLGGSGWQSSPSMSLPQMERADEVLLHVDY